MGQAQPPKRNVQPTWPEQTMIPYMIVIEYTLVAYSFKLQNATINRRSLYIISYLLINQYELL